LASASGCSEELLIIKFFCSVDQISVARIPSHGWLSKEQNAQVSDTTEA